MDFLKNLNPVCDPMPEGVVPVQKFKGSSSTGVVPTQRWVVSKPKLRDDVMYAKATYTCEMYSILYFGITEALYKRLLEKINRLRNQKI